ncbi:glycosyltransferase family 4 protein [Limnoglobus roseus]|uniref:GT4 family glycosyltransferase n=1 Tax=Limnoglobus roseus TaxID=2598579 RepID=A0A5C1AAG2_9BACT|nr:glycosyltransferase family 4 protein [Limnoglobus roseus]QEL15555.1 GT4 family glycosyltransferase [Limnoglobus roseus]
MKIAFVSYECPPEAGGGIGTYVAQAARMMAARGHRVEIFAGSADRTGRDEWPDGVVVHRVAAADRRTFPAKIARVIAERNQVVSFDVIEGPDYMAEAGETRKLIPDVPFVVKLHTSLLMVKQIEAEVIGPVRRLQARWQAFRRGQPPEWSPRHPVAVKEMHEVRTADRIASPSRSIGERVVAEWEADAGRVDFFPYPFEPAAEYLAIPPGGESQVVTFVGRLEMRKGVINLARAIPRVLRACPKAKFWFVGGMLGSPTPGVSMQEYLQRMLRKQAASVEFLGRRPPESLPEILAQSAVTVFPSLWESFGYVCLEAMAAGRAVIGSRNCGLAELLDGGRLGRVVDPRSPADLAAKIVELLHDARLRAELGAAARERVLSAYAPDTVGPQQEASYERAVAVRQPIPMPLEAQREAQR